VEAFEPKDIYPCTVDERTWSKEVSMKELFGHLCYDGTFSHDQKMHEQLEFREGHPARKKIKREKKVSRMYRSRASGVKNLWYLRMSLKRE
jgi:hypothetical protein